MNKLFKKGTTDYNWDKIPVGSKFTGKIDGVKVSGRIQKEDNKILFCQNKKRGYSADDKLGYKYSWSGGQGINNSVLSGYYITDLQITLDPTYKYVPPVKMPFKVSGNKVLVYDHKVKVGCHVVTFDQLQNIYDISIERQVIKKLGK